MKQWEADFGNDPYDDYNLIVEILCDDRDVAVIKQSHGGAFINWYPHDEELIVPLDWLSGLLLETKQRLPEIYDSERDSNTSKNNFIIGQWSATFDQACDEHNLSVKILCDNENVAVIQKDYGSLFVKWYPNSEGLIILLEWLSGLIFEATRRFSELSEH